MQTSFKTLNNIDKMIYIKLITFTKKVKKTFYIQIFKYDFVRWARSAFYTWYWLPIFVPMFAEAFTTIIML